MGITSAAEANVVTAAFFSNWSTGPHLYTHTHTHTHVHTQLSTVNEATHTIVGLPLTSVVWKK